MRQTASLSWNIRVYRNADCRLTMEDFFAKLALNFPQREA